MTGEGVMVLAWTQRGLSITGFQTQMDAVQSGCSDCFKNFRGPWGDGFCPGVGGNPVDGGKSGFQMDQCLYQIPGRHYQRVSVLDKSRFSTGKQPLDEHVSSLVIVQLRGAVKQRQNDFSVYLTVPALMDGV